MCSRRLRAMSRRPAPILLPFWNSHGALSKGEDSGDGSEGSGVPCSVDRIAVRLLSPNLPLVGNGVVGRKKAQQVSPPGVPRPLRAIVPEVLRYECEIVEDQRRS